MVCRVDTVSQSGSRAELEWIDQYMSDGDVSWYLYSNICLCSWMFECGLPKIEGGADRWDGMASLCLMPFVDFSDFLRILCFTNPRLKPRPQGARVRQRQVRDIRKRALRS